MTSEELANRLRSNADEARQVGSNHEAAGTTRWAALAYGHARAVERVADYLAYEFDTGGLGTLEESLTVMAQEAGARYGFMMGTGDWDLAMFWRGCCEGYGFSRMRLQQESTNWKKEESGG